MKYFHNITTLDELKKEYRRLVMKHHPDRGGDTATMQEINNEHDILFEQLKKAHNEKADEYHKTTEAPEEFRAIITALLKLEGLSIELCGSWLWIGGNTKEHKDTLKAIGCRWSNNKKLWYWHHAEEGHHYRKSHSSMGDIRMKYGSQVFTGNQEHTGHRQLNGATA